MSCRKQSLPPSSLTPPAVPMVQTETTRFQQETEQECSPFFVELSSLRADQRDHLVQVGLLPNHEEEYSVPEGETDKDLASQIQLLRQKHCDYLKQVWTSPLKAPFVSLDSSRPWILYWCLHGYDLMQGSTASCTNRKNVVSNEQGCNMVATLKDCWQSHYTQELPSIINTDDIENQDLLYFARHEQDLENENDHQSYKYYCGGFGGGPGQLAHAATTYAAVLVFSILATDARDDIVDVSGSGSEEGSSPPSQSTTHYSDLAKEFLQYVRIPMYRWMVSLQQPLSGGYRMHHDGEIDVRATYTIITCAKLLGLLPSKASDRKPSVLQRPQVVNFVVSCQTYEGGMGGEPFSEAHGGYTFCGLAALNLMGALIPTSESRHDTLHPRLDLDALLAWLARRQMAYEGGFSGRSNKLVDGCYSFWQGGAMAIASACCSLDGEDSAENKHFDPWLCRHLRIENDQSHQDLSFPLLFDVAMLERYILLCAQEVHGGLRDKPSKPRDYYHTCYNLSGLAISQHCSNQETDLSYGDDKQTRLLATHPCYNIRIDRVVEMLNTNWTE
jgi:protein farnesyltransferase subunit beta